jgi:hypothetical protein
MIPASPHAASQPKYLAGCLDCFGLTPRWRGNKAKAMADAHAAETGHKAWAEEQKRLKPKGPAQTPPRSVKPPLPPRLEKPTPLHPGRLSKRAMCDGKAAHRSAASAEGAMRMIRGDREFLNVYECLYCGKWHVGHVIKPGR